MGKRGLAAKDTDSNFMSIDPDFAAAVIRELDGVDAGEVIREIERRWSVRGREREIYHCWCREYSKALEGGAKARQARSSATRVTAKKFSICDRRVQQISRKVAAIEKQSVDLVAKYVRPSQKNYMRLQDSLGRLIKLLESNEYSDLLISLLHRSHYCLSAQ